MGLLAGLQRRAWLVSGLRGEALRAREERRARPARAASCCCGRPGGISWPRWRGARGENRWGGPSAVLLGRGPPGELRLRQPVAWGTCCGQGLLRLRRGGRIARARGRPVAASWAARLLEGGGPPELVAVGPPVQVSAWALGSGDVQACPEPPVVSPIWEGLEAVIAGRIGPGGRQRYFLAHL
ncbi:hypothetical protein NDU88_006145 [Pleurodeles waltl]|uniref:Uncharacterized protein n=1 Tax=Pleurodeles waltl TaxID=8319 RepID=A0AAV7LN86_PLEWA|nr:hypothetical protein NDU88_006145 [Pleurodeles waltl]